MWSDAYVGWPFREPGFRCGDLVRQALAGQFGIETADPGPAADASSYVAQALASGEWHRVEKPQAGDVLLMNTAVAHGEAAPLHVGIMATATHVLHVDRGSRSKCESIHSPAISHRIEGFYRHKSMGSPA